MPENGGFMRFRPCIDIHNGQVKQIVGGSLRDRGDYASENFASNQDAVEFARIYHQDGLRGGHIILLNPESSPYFQETRAQALSALRAFPGEFALGGGVRPDNAEGYLEAGASHVIVTSYVFSGGKLNEAHLEEMVSAVGRDRLILDLSCRRRGKGYFIVTDRWQKFTHLELSAAVLKDLASFCDEFLVHGVDAEGRQQGPQLDLVDLLSQADHPSTYAGGIGTFEDLEEVRKYGKGRVDLTIGSALDLFGGSLSYLEVVSRCEKP